MVSGNILLDNIFCRQKRATQARREMEALEEGEDTNHIMVLPSNGGTNPAGEGGGGEQGGEKSGFQKPKPRMQVEIRQARNKNEELSSQVKIQGVYKRVVGEDQPKNGKPDPGLRISTKGNFLISNL